MLGSVKVPPIKGGRPRSITTVILESLYHYLIEKPTLSLEEIVSNKIARVKARERNLNLRDKYYYFILDFKSSYLIYIDESKYIKG
ncbi:hypothetical protein N7491_004288 [Penicillium cf. griseofulvum]|nr:hypothetical protein N7445_011194 [Penicillium cf. griseofulvum]KAJ5433693.1 hypothetical protein N7491_004288 [Penicillium cf. griseofulvum]